MAMKPLPQRVALVTGSSSGIGEGIAIVLAEAGVKVVVTGRRQDRLDAIVERIAAAGGEAHAIAGDVKDESFARDLVTQTVARYGAIDILVNSAGTIQKGSYLDCDTQEWRDTMDLNLFASLYTSVEALRHMKDYGAGDIIQISSTSARRGAAIFGSYAASKHALNGMAFTLRQEAGEAGVRVCVIEPGATTSDMAAQMADPQAAAFMQAHTHKEDAMKPEDIGAMVVAICALPHRTNVQELLIRPTSDTAGF